MSSLIINHAYAWCEFTLVSQPQSSEEKNCYFPIPYTLLLLFLHMFKLRHNNLLVAKIIQYTWEIISIRFNFTDETIFFLCPRRCCSTMYVFFYLVYRVHCFFVKIFDKWTNSWYWHCLLLISELKAFCCNIYAYSFFFTSAKWINEVFKNAILTAHFKLIIAFFSSMCALNFQFRLIWIYVGWCFFSSSLLSNAKRDMTWNAWKRSSILKWS